MNATRHDTVTFVIAPAGYGKTTLLDQWVAASENPVAWVSLEPSENDVSAFLAYILAAIRSVDPPITSVRSGEVEQTSQVVTTLLNDLERAPHPFSLVLDDYHVIEAPEVHDIVQALIDYAPDGFHLMISSRIEPPFPLARRRVLGQVAMIGMDDLRFTLTETQTLYSQLGISFSDGDVVVLHERTAGWVAGLQIAATSKRDDDPHAADLIQRIGATTGLLHDYLLEEVLEQQPANLQEFLLKTSLLERFSVDLLRIVMTDASVPALVDQARRANLLVAVVDDRSEWFQYHQLLHEFLRQHARRWLPQKEVAKTYQSASHWFQQQGLVLPAVDSALAARDWRRAVELLLSSVSTWLGGEDVATMASRFDSLPVGLIESSPVLSAYNAWTLIHAGRLAEAERRLAFAKQAFEPAGDALNQAIVSLANAEIARHQDNGDALLRHATDALEILPHGADDSPRRESPLMELHDPSRVTQYLSALARVQIGAGQWRQGRVIEAEQTLREATEQSPAHDPECYGPASYAELGNALERQGQLLEASQCYRSMLASERTATSQRHHVLIRLAGIYREWNRLDEAQRLLDECHQQVEQSQIRTWTTHLHLAQSFLAWTHGLLDEAHVYARDAIEAAKELGNTHQYRDAEAFIARIQLGQGNVGAAVHWAYDSRLAPEDTPEYPRFREHLVYARVLISQDETKDAIALLERMLASAESDGRIGDVIEILVLIATAYQDLFELDKAVNMLDRALRLAAPRGYIRMFADEGTLMVRLLKIARRRGMVIGYSQRILAAMGELRNEPSKLYHEDLVEPITARELEVLRLIASGLSNREISDELFISVSTVKRHITNLYGKLGAATRTAALQSARQLGLLSCPSNILIPPYEASSGLHA